MPTENQTIDETITSWLDQAGEKTLPPRQIADQAILTKDDDLLRRTPFAEHLARFISEWHDNYGLVIALHGPWGSGKSSIKNIVLENLRVGWQAKRDNNQPGMYEPLLEFNPWRWAGQDQITTAFFNELGKTIGKVQPTQEQRDRVASKWKEYGAILTVGASVADSLGAILPFIGVPTLGIPGAISKVLRQSAGVTKTGAEGAEAQAKRDTKTLEEIKREITTDLEELKMPILIVMDDIDRLTPEELKLLFGLIKASADFPKLVFLLLFQRETVAASLEKVLNIPSGDQYLRKIIQLEFDIPKADPRLLKNELTKAITAAFIDAEKTRVDRARLTAFLNYEADPFFRTLRDIYRFGTTLKFHTGLLRETGALEVDPMDLILLETLRLAAPSVYQEISKSSSILTVTRDQLIDARFENPNEVSEASQKVRALVDKAPEEIRPAVEKFIELLFPLALHLTDTDEDELPYFDPQAAHNQHRACDADGFDRFFLFCGSPRPSFRRRTSRADTQHRRSRTANKTTDIGARKIPSLSFTSRNGEAAAGCPGRESCQIYYGLLQDRRVLIRCRRNTLPTQNIVSFTLNRHRHTGVATRWRSRGDSARGDPADI